MVRRAARDGSCTILRVNVGCWTDRVRCIREDLEMTYRERRLARYFQDPEKGFEFVLGPGNGGMACRNIRIALRSLDFDLNDFDAYDNSLLEAIRALQRREGHKYTDGLTGPGTRGLLVKTLCRDRGERIFSLMTYPAGEAFPRVFVSYARVDRRCAESVVHFLVSQGVEVWVDYMNLHPGEKWQHAIEQAIPRCRYFLALISRFALI